MTGCEHLLQGTASRGGKSPGIQLLALHAPQMARRRGFRTSLLVSDIRQKIAGAGRWNKGEGEPETLHQLAHRLIAVNQKLRTPAEVRNRDLIHVNAQALIE